jgi:hypothetical protein
MLLHVSDALRHATKARILRCQRLRECSNVTDKDSDGKISTPLRDRSLPIVRGLPRCILEENDKNTEMSLLLRDSEEQLQEVRSSYEIKRAAVLQQLHEIAARIDNVVVLFPSSLKWCVCSVHPVWQLSLIDFSCPAVCLSQIILMCRFQTLVCVSSNLEKIWVFKFWLQPRKW